MKSKQTIINLFIIVIVVAVMAILIWGRMNGIFMNAEESNKAIIHNLTKKK
jgi:ABC-type cobalt transport system substrate-binding protein